MPKNHPGYLIFTFPSAHQAMAGEDALRAADIALSVVPPPPEVGPGCGLALRIEAKDEEAAKQALGSSSVMWSGLHDAPFVL